MQPHTTIEINWDLIIKVLELLVIPLFWRFTNKLDKMYRMLQDLNIVVIGVDGKNGLRSRVSKLENWRLGVVETGEEG